MVWGKRSIKLDEGKPTTVTVSVDQVIQDHFQTLAKKTLDEQLHVFFRRGAYNISFHVSTKSGTKVTCNINDAELLNAIKRSMEEVDNIRG